MHQLHLVGGEAGVLCHFCRHNSPAGAAGRGAAQVYSGRKEPNTAQPGGLQAIDRQQGQVRVGGFLQDHHGVWKPKAPKHRKGRKGVSLEGPGTGTEEDHFQVQRVALVYDAAVYSPPQPHDAGQRQQQLRSSSHTDNSDGSDERRGLH